MPKAKTSSKIRSTKTTKKKPAKLKFGHSYRRWLPFAVLFALVGSFFIYSSFAATNTVSYKGQLSSSEPTRNYTVSVGDVGTLTAAHNSKDAGMRVSILDSTGNVLGTKTGARASASAAVSPGTYSVLVDYSQEIKGIKKYTATITYPVISQPPPAAVDTTPPTALVTSPTVDTVSGTVNFSATAQDNIAVSKVEFLVDGTVVSSDSSSPYSYAWNTATVIDGNHTLTIKAHDSSNNVGTASRPITVTNTVASPPPPTTSELTWAPPAGWQNYTVKNVTSSTSLTSIDGGGGNVLIKLPTTSAVGPITIQNCVNAVLIGGQIDLLGSAKVNNADQRAIYIKNCTGIVHIEGVYINGDRVGAEGDGIAIDADYAIVQVQNVRIHKLYGGQDRTIHNHSDIIQPWGGVKELRVDRLSGTSNYQGLQINSDLGPIGTVTIKNTNVGDSGVPPPTSAGGYYVWLKCASGTKYTFTNAFVKPRGSFTLDRTIWSGSYCDMAVNGAVASFTHSDITSGSSWTKGDPPNGDFVPAGSVGLNYQHKW